MHGLEAIANLRKRTADDDGHGVVDVARLHLLVDINRLNTIKKIAILVTHNRKFYPLRPSSASYAALVIPQ